MAMNWFRTSQVSTSYDVGGLWMCAIPSAAIYRRVRWSWGFSGDTTTETDMQIVGINTLTAGLVTTIGNGTETPPNAIANSADVAPPTQRWLWWETRQAVVSAIDQGAGVVSWRDSGPQEIPDVKTQVLATGIPGGDTLNLWFTWASLLGAWDLSGTAVIWVATSVLYTT